MKTILFTFQYDDIKAREVLSSARGKLANMGYEALAPSDIQPGEDIGRLTTDFIKRASLVIAFVTERSANVLFEAGYAFGLGKNVLLVSDMSSNLPADLRSVVNIDSRSATSDISFEIVRHLTRLESSGWQPEVQLPTDLRGMLALRTTRPEQFELVSEESFERAIAEEFTAQGFVVQHAPGPQEYGFDLRLRDDTQQSMLVEIKKRNPNSRISISSVQQLLGAAHAYDDRAALLICTSGFTDSAREFAMRQSPRIRLWAMTELEQFVQNPLSSPKIDEMVNLQH